MGRTMQRSQRDAEEAERRKGQAWWGIAGLLLGVAFLGIAFGLSEPVGKATQNFAPGMGVDAWRLIVGVGIFLALMSIFGMIYAVFAPKRKEITSERELGKERRMIQNELAMRKERQKQTRKQIAKARREGK